MEMMKLNFQKETDEGKTEELISSLLSNRYVMEVMKANGLDESVIRRYPWRFKKWLEDFSPCINCRGIEDCHQMTKGYFNNPVYDGILQIEKKACRYEREKLVSEKHLDNFLINEMPSDCRTVSFSNISSNEDDDYLGSVDKCTDSCMQNKGLFLYGPMGTGKTYLACCAANYMARNDRKVCFINYPEFTRRMASLVRTGEHQKYIERLCYCDFLVIDEIGGEAVTAWNRDQILFTVLAKRYDSHLTTWFTSNEDLNSLKQHFAISGNGREEDLKAERIFERIAKLAEPVRVLGEDRRKLQ